MIDLHCHTNKSDGSMEAKDIIKMASTLGVTNLAITDHDTTLAVEEALEESKKFDIDIIPGIEISAYDYFEGKNVHVLGYHVDVKNKTLQSFCKNALKSRSETSKQIVKDIVKCGYNINWDIVKKYAEDSSCVNKKHIMLALMEMGYCDSIYSDIYKKILQCKGQKTSKYISADEAIKLIIMSGGVPVLAHPGVFGNFNSIKRWIRIGLQGIEAEHPYHSVKDMEMCKEFAQKYNLIKTGGSDFHGAYGYKKHKLGCNYIYEDVIENLLERKEHIALNSRAV